MDRPREFAKIIACQKCTLHTSGKLLRDGGENVPQPGYIGSRYTSVRVFLVGQNPGVGPQRFAVEDAKYTAALRALRDAPNDENLFATSSAAVPLEMTRWDKALLRALYTTEHGSRMQMSQMETTAINIAAIGTVPIGFFTAEFFLARKRPVATVNNGSTADSASCKDEEWTTSGNYLMTKTAMFFAGCGTMEMICRARGLPTSNISSQGSLMHFYSLQRFAAGKRKSALAVQAKAKSGTSKYQCIWYPPMPP